MRTDQGYLFIFAVLVGVALGVLMMQPSTVFNRGAAQPQQPSIGPSSQPLMTSNVSNPLPRIFDRTKNSVVSVRVEGSGSGAQGSGFVYDRDGHIVTNEHVVDGAEEVEVEFLNGKQLQAEVVGTDAYTDLAVLRVDPSRVDLRPLPLGDTDNVRVGQRVAAIGGPFGLRNTMTAGIISQKDRLLRTEGRFSIPGVLQTDAAINPGNSGGPLLNMRGEVIGVNTAIQSQTRTFAGVGFAVSADAVKRVVPRLIEQGEYRHPWIGVSGVDVSPEISQAMGLDITHGFLVVDVVEDSPAARAGLEAGDREVSLNGRQVTVGGDVIVGIDDRPVRKIDDILNYLAKETSVGDTVTLDIIRDGERKEVELTLARRPQPQ
ncbi:MAG: trypsin-like peptidase domain-containing protein [Candidatus Nanohaloarchaea archaeon]|nr:trypsin-like peptidase domain-containing protein [Candidatus Nanohaloarchaea archaeon]